MTDWEDSDYSTHGSSTEFLGWLTSPGDSGVEYDTNRTTVRRKVRLTRERRHFLYNLRQKRLNNQDV